MLIKSTKFTRKLGFLAKKPFFSETSFEVERSASNKKGVFLFILYSGNF